MTRVLDQSIRMSHFWIDDILMRRWRRMYYCTQGQLLPDLAHPVQQEILRGSLYTPELMVPGDIRAEEIRLVWGKVVRCEDC